MNNLNISNINCRDCDYFNKEKKECSIIQGSPIRKCVFAINKEIVKKINNEERDVDLLEIGCGCWSYIKSNSPKNLHWDGIDIVDIDNEGRKTIATRIGSVDKIPFGNNKFDYVLANQSIEHWYEFGVNFKKALSEISRVLKKEGQAMFNFPIYLHGHRIFLKGQKEKIYSLFNNKHWEIIFIKKWRYNPDPLKKYQGWKLDTFSNCLGANYDNKSTYIMEVLIKKKSDININFLQSIYFYFSKSFTLYLNKFNKKIIILFNRGFILSYKILKKKI